MDFFSIFTLLGALALFLYGMDTMGKGLKKLSGNSLESFLDKLTSNRIKGFFLGLGVTALIQSSSATIVMLVGFVNSGIMKLSQTIGVILGANLGTTITAWLLSTTEISGTSFIIRLFKPESFTPVLMLIGVIILMFSGSEKKKNIAKILIGFSILIFGMQTMSGAVSGLKDYPKFRQMITMLSHPAAGIIVGTLITIIIQSSSASIGILQALSFTGAIPFSTAIPIILGMNIGAAITPLISAINGNTSAKRVAVAGLYIKIIGVVVVASGFYIVNSVSPFAFMDKPVNAVSIASVHTIYNILSTIILLPFCNQIEKLAVITVRSGKTEMNDKFDTLDPRFLTVPSFAVEKSRVLVNEMATISKNSFIAATKMLFDYNKDTEKEILENEDLVDKFEDKLGDYLVRIAGRHLGNKDSKEVSQLLHVIGDIERISDHSVNVMEAAAEIKSKNIKFTDDAVREINIFTNAITEILTLTTDALVNMDNDKARLVEPLEQTIDNIRLKIKNNHIRRLQDGFCTIEHGFVLSDILTNYERTADHCSNIAESILSIADNNFEAHEYMRHIKNDGENNFLKNYEDYMRKYAI